MGQYRYLSNFWPCAVVWEGQGYKSVEHAYQSAKSTDVVEREQIQFALTAGLAKKLGRKLKHRRLDWDSVRVSVMHDLLRQKFADPHLGRRLLETGDAQLIEGNYWGDTFWGVCDGKGENWLGKLLMEVREEISKR